jgi:hypothetical protein
VKFDFLRKPKKAEKAPRSRLPLYPRQDLKICKITGENCAYHDIAVVSVYDGQRMLVSKAVCHGCAYMHLASGIMEMVDVSGTTDIEVFKTEEDNTKEDQK